MHCSVMGQEALEAAIEYYKSGGKKTAPPEKEGKVVCTCFNVTDREIERAIRENKLKTIEDVTNFTKAGGGCGGCHEQIQEMLDKINGGARVKTQPPARLTTLQKIDRIREVIVSRYPPHSRRRRRRLRTRGRRRQRGDVRFKGHCNGCAFSNNTLVSVVEKKLREKVAENLKVKMV